MSKQIFMVEMFWLFVSKFKVFDKWLNKNLLCEFCTFIDSCFCFLVGFIFFEKLAHNILIRVQETGDEEVRQGYRRKIGIIAPNPSLTIMV